MDMNKPYQIIKDSKIEFYKAGCVNGFYSNLFPASFVDINNKCWATSEHYYQAHKYSEYPKIMEKLRNIKKPRDVSSAGRDKDIQMYISIDWNDKKDLIMKEALKYKFQQNNNLKKLLLESGDARIIEVTEHDNYWACGDGTGLNKLGKFLMDLRSSLTLDLIKNVQEPS